MARSAPLNQSELPPPKGTRTQPFSDMGWLTSFREFWQRHQKVKRVTRAVHREVPRIVPGAQISWSIIAENHPQECVLYLTYLQPDQPGVKQARYFRVRLDDWTVTMLEENYRPERWGPYL